MPKQYLGDGVYVEVDGFGDMVLTTHDGDKDTNRIVLEPNIQIKLVNAIEEMVKSGGC